MAEAGESVSGTAWAMSEPTIRAVGSFGYSRMRQVTPIAPAPTDEIDTSVPRMPHRDPSGRCLLRRQPAKPVGVRSTMRPRKISTTT